MWVLISTDGRRRRQSHRHVSFTNKKVNKVNHKTFYGSTGWCNAFERDALLPIAMFAQWTFWLDRNCESVWWDTCKELKRSSECVACGVPVHRRRIAIAVSQAAAVCGVRASLAAARRPQQVASRPTQRSAELRPRATASVYRLRHNTPSK